MHPLIFHRELLGNRHTTTTANTAAAPRTTPRAESPLRRVMRGLARNWHRRRMIAALQAMDDWLLRDIGIERDDIERVVDGLDERELKMTPVARSVGKPRTDRTPQPAQMAKDEVRRLAA